MNKKICLIDGSGYIFRAFYALPTMTSPTGIPVNAVYGFTNMFLKLTQRLKCDYCLVLFDAKRQNYRNDIFADYKGTRKETPEELIPQFAIIREALDALNIHYLDMEGYEADDLIATYTAEGLKDNNEITIISADKDLMQLIRPHVEFYDPMKDKFFTPEDVKEKFGVYPEKVIDVQALAGDSTDNIPGVPGIGLKTAAELVNQFGSLEEILTRANEIKQNKRRETILNNIEQARISLQLVTLKADVPVQNKIETYPCQSPIKSDVMNFIDKYGFNSIRTRIEKWVDEQCQNHDVKTKINANYTLITTETELKEFCQNIKRSGRFSFNIETSGSNPQTDKPIGISLCDTHGNACYIPLDTKGEDANTLDLFSASTPRSSVFSKEQIKNNLSDVLTNDAILKISHDAKTNIHFIKQIIGYDCEIKPIDDTSILSYILDGSNHKHLIPELADIFLDLQTINLDSILGTGKNKIKIEDIPPAMLVDYSSQKYFCFALRV